MGSIFAIKNVFPIFLFKLGSLVLKARAELNSYTTEVIIMGSE